MKQDKDRKAFLYYVDWAEALLQLPDALRLKIDDAVKRYVIYGEEPTDPIVKYSMFTMMRLKIDKDTQAYAEKCDYISQLRSNAGSKGNDIRWGDNRKVSQTSQNIANDSKNRKVSQTSLDIDTDTDTVTDKKKKELSNESKKSASRFSAPSLEEIKDFAEKEGLEFDVESMYDYYESNGWCVGKSKMKNWKAAARNWARRENDFSKSRPQQNSHDARRGNMEVTATSESDYKTTF